MPAVILPSETQSREFDAKLLLACCLAERGIATYVGSRVDIHNRIHKLPASIYLAKDFRKPSNRIFRILEGLGVVIVAWDEEGLVFFDPAMYHSRRVHAETLSFVREFFAWGPLNSDLISTAPGYDDQPLHVFGNPRADMLRPELRELYAEDVRTLRDRFGKFILVNTNFGQLNHFLPNYVVKPGDKNDPFIRGAMTSEMNESWVHRAKLFEGMKGMIAPLAERFPDRTIVVRPHPSENHAAWHEVSAGCQNVTVVHEGSVHPWLMACELMIHSSCSTGIEGYLLGTNVISYRPAQSDKFDHKTSNELSHQVFSLDELLNAAGGVVNAGTPLPTSQNNIEIAERMFASMTGPLASEQIADRLVQIAGLAGQDRPWLVRMQARAHSQLRAAFRTIARQIPNHKNSAKYNLKRFPGIAVDDVNRRIGQLGCTLHRFDGVKAHLVYENIFCVRNAN